MWYPRWESKTVPDFNRTVSSHPMLRYPWAFLTIFSFHSPLPLTDIVLWATMKAGGPTGAERETGNSGYSLWDTCTIQHVHPNLSPSAGYPTFGLAWLQLSLGWSSNLRCPLKIPLPSGLNLNVSTIYRSCFDLTLLYFPASLPSLLNYASVHHSIWTSLQVPNISPFPFFLQQMFECLTHARCWEYRRWTEQIKIPASH